MTLSATDRFAIAYRVRPPGPSGYRGPGQPLTKSERNELARLRRAGELPPYPRLASRLEDNGFRTPGGCLEWTRARHPKGYGKVKRGGRVQHVHRLALEAKLGRPLAPGMVARHVCDNPPCFEPDHLIEGTPAENNADIYAHGARSAR